MTGLAMLPGVTAVGPNVGPVVPTVTLWKLCVELDPGENSGRAFPALASAAESASCKSPGWAEFTIA